MTSQLEKILDALQQYADDSTAEYASKARGFITSLGNGNAVIGLKMALQIITSLENLNRAVQCRTSSVSGMVDAMKLISNSLEQFCSEENFRELFSETEELCVLLDIPHPTVP